uniref:Uncharacterized protein n=1 Tax=Populus trichocarpa TaxID=3694 RepID=A0A3N7HNT1_POPTR
MMLFLFNTAGRESHWNLTQKVSKNHGFGLPCADARVHVPTPIGFVVLKLSCQVSVLCLSAPETC